MSMTATYSPDDNKLRLYPVERLAPDLYERVRASGFKWAPRQKLFVAPMWSPGREDLLIELCGSVGDEDKSLAARAEERAERFEDYSDKRERDAHAAHAAVSAITDNIPLGQPILIGHHSEKHARRDAERIENGMRKAVKMWETSKYWTDRAAAAVAHAEYKELPAVRYRRMKGIESDKRKQERSKGHSERCVKLWNADGLTTERALGITNTLDHISKTFTLAEFPRDPPASQYEGSMGLWSALRDGVINETQARDIALRVHARTIARANRWIAHYDNRLAYERAMLAESGALAVAIESKAIDVQPGGKVLIGGEWLVIMRVNKKSGVPVSITTSARYCRVKGLEEITEYRAPDPADASKVKAATKLPPLVNYPGEGFLLKTKAEWNRKPLHYGTVRVAAATEQHGRHRYRSAFRPGGNFQMARVYITDAKRVDPPPAAAIEPASLPREPALPTPRPSRVAAQRTPFDDMRDQLKHGVRVVAAPELFPTPATLAERMVLEADLQPGQCVLEPSAGTGAILKAIRSECPDARVTAVEIRQDFAHLANMASRVHYGDFLQCNGELGKFDRILMNPPFSKGQDVEHVTHALHMLQPTGRLVAVMSSGVTFRQDKATTAFRELVERRGGSIEALPDGTFKESGTNASTVLVVI